MLLPESVTRARGCASWIVSNLACTLCTRRMPSCSDSAHNSRASFSAARCRSAVRTSCRTSQLTTAASASLRVVLCRAASRIMRTSLSSSASGAAANARATARIGQHKILAEDTPKRGGSEVLGEDDTARCHLCTRA
eukprot:scaffold6725_cov117-Isochrysis_galbana.AAC.3